MDSTQKPVRLVRGSYWCPQQRKILSPGQAGYSRAMFEQLTLGPLELGMYGDDSEDEDEVRVAS